MPASPRFSAPPPPPGFSGKLPVPEVRSRPQPPPQQQQQHSLFAQPPLPPPPAVAPTIGSAVHPISSSWPQTPSPAQQSLFSQQPIDTGSMMPGSFLHQVPMPQMAVPPKVQSTSVHAQQAGMAAAAQQRAALGQGTGTPHSWQSSQGASGPQQSQFGRAVQEHTDPMTRQSLDSQQHMSSLGGLSKDGSRRQSLENAAPGSLPSYASTRCASEAGSLVNTPRATLADTSSSLFAHAPYPASPSHALAAAAAQAAISQPMTAYPGASRLSGRSTSLLGATPADALSRDGKAMPDLTGMPALQHAGLSFGSGSLQLTPSHFGTNVSANTGQGEHPASPSQRWSWAIMTCRGPSVCCLLTS